MVFVCANPLAIDSDQTDRQGKSNLLRSPLAPGSVQCIAATTKATSLSAVIVIEVMQRWRIDLRGTESPERESQLGEEKHFTC